MKTIDERLKVLAGEHRIRVCVCAKGFLVGDVEDGHRESLEEAVGEAEERRRQYAAKSVLEAQKELDERLQYQRSVEEALS